MLSQENNPLNTELANTDFVEKNYYTLLRLAKKKYKFVAYNSIPWGARFVLWRHDLDHSINRARALAQLEYREGLCTTYFVNPTSRFYNPFEKNQKILLQEILEMGHWLGLHFDSDSHHVQTEKELTSALNDQSCWLEQALGIRPIAFSFHNPSAKALKFEAESYAGLVNCYSRRLKTEIPYCSDSNGYWRFRRLHDVLSSASDPCLQILTHPEWWQKYPMPPRQRIFRCVQGRGSSAMRYYDTQLKLHERLNHADIIGSLKFLVTLQPRVSKLWDYLANTNQYQTLFMECWRSHELQINNLCKAMLRKEWRVPAQEVNAIFEDRNIKIEGWKLFEAVFGTDWKKATGVSVENYSKWIEIRNQLMHSRGSASRQQLKKGISFLCQITHSLAAWGQKQKICYNGIKHLESIRIPTSKTADGNDSDRLEKDSDKILKNFPQQKLQALIKKLKKSQLCIPTP